MDFDYPIDVPNGHMRFILTDGSVLDVPCIYSIQGRNDELYIRSKEYAKLVLQRTTKGYMIIEALRYQ